MEGEFDEDICSLDDLIRGAGLIGLHAEHIRGRGLSLADLALALEPGEKKYEEKKSAPRDRVLVLLKEAGIDRPPDRQKLVNQLAKAKRERRLKPSDALSEARPGAGTSQAPDEIKNDGPVLREATKEEQREAEEEKRRQEWREREAIS
jgi:hypothetical protein